jgi:gliding motility-associated-like protein
MPANLCAGSTTLINLNSTLSPSATPGGTWSGPGVTGSTFNPTGLTGSVTITYTVGTGICQQTASQIVNINTVNAAFTATPTSGDAPLVVDFINGSTGANAYQWTFGNGGTSTNTNDSTIYMNQGTYVVTLIATNTTTGCSDTVRATIEVFEHSILTVPNVFTPNGDGNNDFFLPILAEGLTTYKLLVYDRWGLKMFESVNDNKGWDGRAKNGSPAPDGTYYYIITANGIDKKEYEFTGYVQLIRK